MNLVQLEKCVLVEISFSETDLNDRSFYFDTLKFDRESWSFNNGKLTLRSNNANLKTFYQLFIEENAGGSVNLKEAILKYGVSVKLIFQFFPIQDMGQ